MIMMMMKTSIIAIHAATSLENIKISALRYYLFATTIITTIITITTTNILYKPLKKNCNYIYDLLIWIV